MAVTVAAVFGDGGFQSYVRRFDLGDFACVERLCIDSFVAKQFPYSHFIFLQFRDVYVLCLYAVCIWLVFTICNFLNLILFFSLFNQNLDLSDV